MPTAITPASSIRWTVLLLCLATTLLGCRDGFPAPLARVLPERIVFLTFDTTRVDYLGAYNPASSNTPNLDSLMSKGVRFEIVHSPVPLTLPAHTTLFTGKGPLSTGVLRNGDVVSQGLTTLAEELRDQGYRTAAFVSLGTLDTARGLDQGFDHYDASFQGLGRWYRRADEIVDAALSWIDEQQSGPFFVWLHLSDPHEPYAAPGMPPDTEVLLDGQSLGQWNLSKSGRVSLTVELQPGRNTLTWKPLGTYETGRKNNLHVRFDSPAQINRLLRGETLVSKREYEMNPDFSLQLQIDGDSPVALDLEFRGRLVRPSKELALEQYPLEIQHLDAQVGRLRDFLSERDLSDKTLWIGVSDHGEGLYDHGHLGHAGAVFEAQLRVAWFMAGPGLPEQTVISEVLSRTEDVYPTLREFLGLVPAADVDGVSKVGCFSGGTCSRSRNTGSYAIAAGGKLTGIAVVEWPYKRLWILDRGVEVHALDADPLEQRNLLESKEPQPAELRDLEAELHSFYLRLEDALAGRPAQTLDEEQERALKSLGYL